MNKSNNNRIRTLRTLCFLLLVVFIDQTSGKILKHLYFNQKAGQGANLNYIFAECRANVLIFGNSRAQHHYDTKIISDSLKMPCYNAGIDGGFSILMSYAQIQVILNRYTPNIIIIEFDPAFLMEYRKDEYEKYSILLPYYSIYPQLRPFIEKRNKMEKVKLLSGIYPYNSNLIWLLRFNTNIDANRNWIYNGYIPIKDKKMNMALADLPIETATQHLADKDKLQALKGIIQLCKSRNIKLYFINSPSYHALNSKRGTITGSTMEVIELLKKEQVDYIDFSNDPHFGSKMTFFADKLHLNEDGATLYSQMIGGIIKNRIK